MNEEHTQRWNEVRRRVESVGVAIEKGFALSTEAQQAVLKDRAHALAREPEAAESVEQSIEIVEFTVANEKYALETRFVREVLNLRELTPVPCMPAFISGIINLRGQI